MNPNVVKVGNKLFLGTQKVELAAPNPKRFEDEAFKAYSESNKFAEKSTNIIVNNYKQTLDAINKMANIHSEEYTDLVKKADDLGLDFSSSQIGKEYLKIGNMLQKYSKETLSQHQKYANIKP